MKNCSNKELSQMTFFAQSMTANAENCLKYIKLTKVALIGRPITKFKYFKSSIDKLENLINKSSTKKITLHTLSNLLRSFNKNDKEITFANIIKWAIKKQNEQL